MQVIYSKGINTLLKLPRKLKSSVVFLGDIFICIFTVCISFYLRLGNFDYLNRNSGGRRYGPGVYSGLLGSGYTLKGNPARFLLPETDNLSPAAAIAGKRLLVES